MPTISVVHDLANQGLLIGNTNPNTAGIDPTTYLTSTTTNVTFIDSTPGNTYALWVWSGTSSVWTSGGASGWLNIGTYDFNSFAAALTTNTITTGFPLPPNLIPMACYIKLQSAFVGGFITSYKVTVGTNSSPAKYHPSQNVHAIPPSPIQPVMSIGIDNSTPDLAITATTIGDNLDQASAGQFELFLYVTYLP